MGMTMIEKILARAAGREQVQAGDTVVCRVDMNILIDLQFTCWVEPLKIADPRRVAIILDHAVPAPTVADADAGVRARVRAPSVSSDSSTSDATASATRSSRRTRSRCPVRY
jgi:3-isopropylmalate/(R)-2-methylmalate dehydratase large subunit